MDNTFNRTSLLIGSDAMDKLANIHVLVVGVGGVGGYSLEILARSGVGHITIVDGDKVDDSNINRQIIALKSTVGKYKVDVFADRLLDINPNLKLHVKPIRYNEDTCEDILSSKFDYVIDAIDSVTDKLHLIVTSKAKGFNIISAMGAGNRYELGDFKIMDIYKTTGDALARKMRKLLRVAGIASLDVCCTDIPTKSVLAGTVGSIAYMPPLSGVKMAGYVLNQLIK